ncbi:alpha-L-rhamnosidase C-terminal domain-containing protein [uncultured Bacteroides sp.]|uniref:alpha-L-rhamnosidase-related protein n=1 Tax=uncultured Bacteroides sp. TaxID=162156 RepID=UPI002AAAAF05|nr:alpha-L-rhamnosidase C-terminal domain-containing protein [uncultured Bacteroides sp.]
MKKHFLLILLLFLMNSSIISASDFSSRAYWISTGLTQSTPNTWLCFRKTFNLKEVPKQLMASIAADTKYWLWINGQQVVFEGGLKRGPAPGDSYYDKIDIAPYLNKDENTIAILVWHFGKNGFTHQNSGTCGLLFSAQSPEISIVSDRNWQSKVYDAYTNTDSPFPNFRLPESNIRFDARKKTDGWNMPGFRENFGASEIVGSPDKAPFGKLVLRPIPMWKNSGLIDYKEIRRSEKSDTIHCKLPYNCQVTPYLKVDAPEGMTIHMLTDNYNGGGEKNVRAEYITCKGVQEYESYGWMNGHEILYVIPAGVKVMELKYRETGYGADIEGSFTCNDPFYNELWKRSARTLYVTMRDNYMDCPDRERSQWWGDEVNELGEAFYAMGLSGQQLAVKGIYELVNWQRADGVMYSPMPAGNRQQELPLQTLASIGWYGFQTQAFYSGDNSFVPAVYDAMKTYLHKVWNVDNNGFPIPRSGEWSWGDWGDNIDMNVLTTCWYYLALKDEKAFALQLGKSEDTQMIENMMKQIEKGFDQRYWTGNAFRSTDYKGETDDRAQAMAVVSGLASKDKYEALRNVLHKEFHASPYMEKYVLESLFQMNDAEFALKRMKQRYEKMLSYKQYTTLFEGWGIGAEGFGGGTTNHAWSGGPLTLLSQKVCGVEPLEPGFKKFRIAPQMGTLTQCSTVIPTKYGKINVNISRKGTRLVLKINVPEGSTAVVHFPGGKEVNLNPGEHSIGGK